MLRKTSNPSRLPPAATSAPLSHPSRLARPPPPPALSHTRPGWPPPPTLSLACACSPAVGRRCRHPHCSTPSQATKTAVRRIELALNPESSGEALRPYAVVFAGLLAGAAAAVVSHPADLLLTRLCGSPTADVATNVAECVIAEVRRAHARSNQRRARQHARNARGPRMVFPPSRPPDHAPRADPSSPRRAS
eukprot:3693756-Prymnesium_polylepis.2